MVTQTFKIITEKGLTSMELLGCLEDTIGTNVSVELIIEKDRD